MQLHKRYEEWISRWLLSPRLRSDPNYNFRVASVLTTLLSNIPPSDRQGVLAAAINSMPPTMEEPFFRAAVQAGILAASLPKRRPLGAYAFNIAAYANAYAQTVREGRADLIAEDGSAFEMRAVCSLASESPVMPLVTNLSETFVDSDWRVQLLLPYYDSVFQALARFRDVLEISEAEVVALAKHLMDLEFEERIAHVDEMLSNSLPAFLLQFEQAASLGQLTPAKFVPRSISKFPRFLGLDGSVISWDAAAESLLGRVSLAIALSRYVGLPVPLPKPIVDAIKSLPPEDRESLIRALVRSHGSGTSAFHVIRLLEYLPDRNTRNRCANHCIRQLCAQAESGLFNTLLTVLQFVSSQLWSTPEGRTWAPKLTLAATWTIAHETLRRSREMGLDEATIRGSLGSNETVSGQLLWGSRDVLMDIAHPYNVGSAALLAAGLRYGLAWGDRVDLHPTTQEAIASVIMDDAGPAYSMYALLNDCTNGMESFITDEAIAALPSLIGEDRYDSIAPYLSELLLGTAIEMIEEGDIGSLSFVHLRLLVGVPKSTELVKRLLSLSRSDLVKDLANRDRGSWQVAMRTFSRFAWYLADESAQSVLTQAIMDSASALGNDLADADVAALLE